MASKQIVAPLSGQVIGLREVPDPTFATGVLGWGVGILPAEGRVYAPMDGIAENVMDTGHAIGITAPDGTELLIHIGKDTVSLNGQYFTLHIKEGDPVQTGQLLVEFDMAAIAAAGYPLVTPVTIIGAGEEVVTPLAAGAVQAGDALMRVED